MSQNERNLNKLSLYESNLERSPGVVSGSTAVYFQNIEERLAELIRASEAIIGCVAWLTNRRLLQEMSTKPISFVVQKEDFLRVDSTGLDPRGDRPFYEGVRGPAPLHEINKFSRHDLGYPVNELSICADESVDRVRCVGHRTTARSGRGFRARMHHKFAVFCRIDRAFSREHKYDARPGARGLFDAGCLVPFAVATGSYNWSANASDSLENLFVISDPTIMRAYRDEWAYLLGLSEPLDWDSEYADPEWREGT